MLREKLAEDMRGAMKGADQQTVGVLRLLIAAVNNKAIEKRGKTGSDVLIDDEVLQVLLSEEKKRRDAIVLFEQGGRLDLAKKEEAELEVIQKYLPRRLGREETERAVEKILKDTAAKDFGSAMKQVMKELKGKADAKLISEIVKQKLGQ